MSEAQPVIAWPPEYKVKRHPRARRVKLRVSRLHGLEITIPPRFNIRNIADVLVEHETWIIKHLTKLAALRTDTLPEQIEFHALNEKWVIHYMHSNTKMQLIERPGHEIVLFGDVTDKQACKDKLINWIKKIAKHHLLSQLQELSIQTRLNYYTATIRDQQTRWGSCNREKMINLNYKLIFLPAYLISHVIIHELCHTKYLNHSERFWNLVAKHDAQADLHRKELRQADKYVPGWM